MKIKVTDLNTVDDVKRQLLTKSLLALTVLETIQALELHNKGGNIDEYVNNHLRQNGFF